MKSSTKWLIKIVTSWICHFGRSGLISIIIMVNFKFKGWTKQKIIFIFWIWN